MGEDWYRGRGIDIVDVDRGGKVTYHGPGQLVGYPIVAIDDVMEYVAQIERAIAAALDDEGIAARGRSHEGIAWTGVWVEDRKLASIGLHVSQGVAKHGFAVNVDNSLEPFGWIVPCGLPEVRMTSVAAEASRRRPAHGLLPQADGVALRRGPRQPPAADVARAPRGRARRDRRPRLSAAQPEQDSVRRRARYWRIAGVARSPWVWRRRRATRSRWYGELSDSLWPITSRTLIPYRQRSHSVRRSEACSWRGLPRRSASRLPTCSIPNAVQFSPTVCRHMIDSGTNCTIVPSCPTTKCEHTLGSSWSSGSGRSGANVL